MIGKKDFDQLDVEGKDSDDKVKETDDLISSEIAKQTEEPKLQYKQGKI